MKNKEYQASKTKKMLYEKKRKGVKEVIWKIDSKDLIEYLEKFFELEPWLYEIRTRTFFNLREFKNTLLRDIHYASKKGKRTIVTRLRASDKKILDDFGIRYRIIKYRIKL